MNWQAMWVMLFLFGIGVGVGQVAGWIKKHRETKKEIEDDLGAI